jgi:hypothetical protein
MKLMVGYTVWNKVDHLVWLRHLNSEPVGG